MIDKRKLPKSEETKQKMRDSHLKYYSTHICSNLGLKRSNETKKKISNAVKGRILSEEHKRKISVSVSGNKHYFWKGGISSIGSSIRSLFEYKIWRKSIFKRDNYTCVQCHVRGGDLEVDHIKQFALILKEFLSFYNQFSPIDDKETLIRLSLTYSQFWNIENGRTLCVKCHKLTETYRQRVS